MKHQQKAKDNADRYMSVILDGMDQAKTFAPHFVTLSKHVSAAWKLRLHVTGAVVHGVGCYGFFDKFEWPHDSNITMTVLLDILAMQTSLPPILYLQLDNCYRDNKNRLEN